jgi:YVTN family beta-propeller protein
MPQRRQATRRFLATVLFTDIVGSTQHAARLGDRAWRGLLERHNAVVRRELKVYGGRELDTAGDGFFAVFEAPERAVRCAESITSAVRSLGIEVRAGVHMGECEVMGGKVAGMAVVIGARIAALAEAGQVLVSGSVRDLMTGSGARFEGGDLRDLKGVEDPWRVYRLVPDPADGGGIPAQRRAPIVPLYTRRQRRRLFGAVAVVLVVLLAVAAGYVLTRPPPLVAVGENAVGVIGPGQIPRVSAAVQVGQRPTALAEGFGSVWVTNSAEDSVSRIDARSHNNSVPIPVGASPAGVAVGAGAVWVANSEDATVSRIDPATSRTITIPVRPGPTGIVFAFGSVWVTNALDASVSRIDPGTNKVAHVVPVGASPTGIAAGADYLWVTNQGDGTVSRFDPKTYVVDSPAVKVGSGPVGIAVTGGAAWVANNLDGSLSRIDAGDLSVTSRTLVKSGGAFGVAAHGGDIWVSNEYAGTLLRVTARTFRLAATLRMAGAPLGLGFVGDDLWFTNAGGGSALHRGGVLTMIGPDVGYAGGAPVTDLTLHYQEEFSRLAAITNDGLVGFRRAGGVQGAGIVPDLATTLPAPSEDGLTYTFHLRTGVHYSTGAHVLAGDIRRGIERTVVHPDSAPADYYANAILGAHACEALATRAVATKKPRPSCDLSQGIVTDDQTGTITFHLTQPTPEFLYQLALPSAAAVPQDTPVDLAPDTFLPATGPYMIHSYIPDRKASGSRPARHGRLELVRNPQFHVWSSAAQPSGYPDRIVLETGYTDQQAEAQVTAGRADLLWKGMPSMDVDRLATRYGSQLHTSSGNGISYLFLNARKPPFDNLDARRALAYALDRRALASEEERSTQVTCQLIPPDFAGYNAYCPFTINSGPDGQWHAQDIATSRELVRRSGARGAKVVVSMVPGSVSEATGRSVVGVLRNLGFRASLVLRRSFYTPKKDWNIGAISWAADYPATSNYLGPIASCDAMWGPSTSRTTARPRSRRRSKRHSPSRSPTPAQQATPGLPSTARWSTPRR